VHSLAQLIAHLKGKKVIKSHTTNFLERFAAFDYSIDFAEVQGQWQAKRALQIAAAGRHNIIFIGGSRSSALMLAARLITILPPLSFDQMLEITKIYSIAGLLKDDGFVARRLFCLSHHTSSHAGLFGGGLLLSPGQVSLAHNSVLFVDELAQFKQNTLETLSQVLENRKVPIAHAHVSLEFPAHFLLVGALNPCSCGFWENRKHICTCSHDQIAHCVRKAVGPLLPKIDLYVRISSIETQELPQNSELEKSSKDLYEKVAQAHLMQQKREKNLYNADLAAHHIEKYCLLSSESRAILRKSFEDLLLNMQSCQKVLKIARTIADMDNSEVIEALHIREALIYSSLDRLLENYRE
jgi:magnesium chelatase family protein